mmetsp:Transcript_61287/g.138708  ORF Transcript_61287/g.138708 Transcript_61287/m.138708 type:complete len:1386 (-) Transcript_61287:74-4231(-)
MACEAGVDATSAILPRISGANNVSKAPARSPSKTFSRPQQRRLLPVTPRTQDPSAFVPASLPQFSVPHGTSRVEDTSELVDWLEDVSQLLELEDELSLRDTPVWEAASLAVDLLERLGQILPLTGLGYVVGALAGCMERDTFVAASGSGGHQFCAARGNRLRTWWKEFRPRPVSPCYPVGHLQRYLDEQESAPPRRPPVPGRNKRSSRSSFAATRQQAVRFTLPTDGGSQVDPSGFLRSHTPPSSKESYAFVHCQRQYLTRRETECMIWLQDLVALKSGYEGTTFSLVALQNVMSDFTNMCWLFTVWHSFARERTMENRQVAVIQRLSDVRRKDILTKWRLEAVLTLTRKVQESLMERQADLKQLIGARVDLDVSTSVVVEQLSEESERSAKNTTTLAQAMQKRQALQQTWDREAPEQRRDVLFAVIKAVLDGLAETGRVYGVLARRREPLHDFAIKVMRDSDTIAAVSRMRSEDMLVRWVNHIVSEVKYAAMELLDSGGDGDGSPDARHIWSTKESQVLRHRCVLVRSINSVESLKVIAHESSVLAAVYAYLRAAGQGEVTFYPSDLWCLDERADNAKADALCSCLQLQVPTRAARCAVQGLDLSQDGWILRPALASLLLASMVAKDHGSRRKALRPMNEAGAAGHAGPTMASLAGFADSEEADVMETLSHAVSLLEVAAGPLAYNAFADPGQLLKADEALADLDALSAQAVLLRWGEFHSGMECEHHDFSDGRWLLLVLLRVAPDIIVGMPGTPEQLVRTLKVGTKPSSPSDSSPPSTPRQQRRGNPQRRRLSTRRSISELSSAGNLLAAHQATGLGCGVSRAVLESFVESLTVKERVDLIIDCGERCVEACMLTPECILENDEDVIMAFLASLFLTRPALSVPRPCLREQLGTLDFTVKYGYSVVDAGLAGESELLSFRALCDVLHSRHEELVSAVADVTAAGDSMQRLECQMQSFVRDTYARRAVGDTTSTTTKQGGRAVRGRKQLSSLRIAVSELLRPSVWKEFTESEDEEVQADRIRVLCQSYVQVVADLFARYSVRPWQQSIARVPLEGILRMYRDTRLRCPCAFLSLAAVEELFHKAQEHDVSRLEKLDDAAAPSKEADAFGVMKGHGAKGLTLAQFLVWILRASVCRREHCAKKDGKQTLDEGLKQLFDNHFKAYVRCLPDDEFGVLSEDPEIRKLLMRHEQVLYSAFHSLSEEVLIPTPESDPAVHMEVASARSYGLHISQASFAALLEETGQMTGLLTRQMIGRIAEQCIQRGGFIGVPLRCAESALAFAMANGKGGAKRWAEQIMQATKTVGRAEGSPRGKPARQAVIGYVEYVEPPVQGSLLTYHEFLEGLVACAVYRFSDPFRQPSDRVDKFLNDDHGFVKNLPRRLLRSN